MPERASLSATLDRTVLDELPASANIFSIIETTQAEAISDRFYTGGLSTGQPARLGGFLTSPSQTVFRVDDVNVMDPDGSGTPLFFPGLSWWERVAISSGLMPGDVNVPGLLVSLTPRMPSERWQRVIEGTGAPQIWVTEGEPGPPPVNRLDNWGHASALVSGPLIANRVGLMAGGSWTRGAHFQREQAIAETGTVESGFAHLVFKPQAADEIRTLGWLQRARYPYADRLPATRAHDSSVHIQSTWDHRSKADDGWRLFGAYTERRRDLDVSAAPEGTIIERLVDGPVPELAPAGDATSRRWTLGGRLTPGFRTSAGGQSTTRIGMDLERVTSLTDPDVIGAIGEVVDGLPARVWEYQSPGLVSKRHATAFAAFVSDQFPLGSRGLLHGGFRYDAVSGRADGATNGVTWRSLLPHAAIRWQVTNRMRVAVFGGYARSAYRLPLGYLAYGDPAAPTADVFRWDATAMAPSSLDGAGPLVARVGPGTGGDPAFSAIDPDLRRPHSDEVVIGVESRPGRFRLGLSGIAKWERNVIAVVNTGVSAPDYATLTVEDPGALPGTTPTVIPVYDRMPSSFGLDRYELTNASLEDPRVLALDFTVRAESERIFFLLGGTAQRAFAPAASRGFHATENDQGPAGELLTNPNAFTHGARVRPFIDRAYTAKLSFVYRFPSDVRLGAIARYQDGQPFAGVIVVPDLNQGAEAVRGFSEGGTRFTYTATLDVRLQKGFRVGQGRLDAMLDVYNLTNHHHEVEERTVLGPGFRTMTALQPPRSVHIGARLTF